MPPMLAGSFAIAAAILTVTGVITLLAFFRTRSSLLGALNDLNSLAMALATLPVALALHPVASLTSGSLATAALLGEMVGVVLAATFTALLVARLATFEATLLPIALGNGLIGIWVLATAALLLGTSEVPTATGLLGVAGGAGLAVASMGFPRFGREHPVIAVAGLSAVIGLVGFFGWSGILMLQGEFGDR